MAQFEKIFFKTYAISAADGTKHVITDLPTVPANSSYLITGVYAYFTGTYAANTTQLFVRDAGAIDYTIFSQALADNTKALFNPSTSFVMLEGDQLVYIFNNTNTGNLTLTITYQLIPNQNLDNSIRFFTIRAADNVINPYIPDLTLFPNDIVFIKSFLFCNQDVGSQTYLVNSLKSAVSYPFRTITLGAGKASWFSDNTALISKTDQFYVVNPAAAVDLLEVSTGGTMNVDAYLSFYYDPLYL